MIFIYYFREIDKLTEEKSFSKWENKEKIISKLNKNSYDHTIPNVVMYNLEVYLV